MPDDFLIAHNEEEDTSLPYLVRIPLGTQGLVLKVRETWPRTSKVYCHRAEWPENPEIIEQIPTRTCTKRGAAIDLVLDRGRENRSQFVLTIARGREMIFWQTARVSKQARPNVSIPTARASGVADLEILVDVHERYAWQFTHQQATTRKQPLAAGDYAVELDDAIVAAVERKSLADLVSTLTTGKGNYLLAALAGLPRAAVVVEDRYSGIFALEHVRQAVVADLLGECQARFPSVPIVFGRDPATRAGVDLPFPRRQPPRTRSHWAHRRPSRRPLRRVLCHRNPPGCGAWARGQGIEVSDRGRLRPEVVAAYLDATRDT